MHPKVQHREKGITWSCGPCVQGTFKLKLRLPIDWDEGTFNPAATRTAVYANARV